MRLLLTTTLTLSLSLLLAQVPQAIKYQAVVRDSTGSILADANVTLRVSIIDTELFGTTCGNIAYSEIPKTGMNLG